MADKFFYRIRLDKLKEYAKDDLQDNELLSKLKKLDSQISSSVETARGSRKLAFRRYRP